MSRSVTSLIIVALCGFAAWHGWQIADFAATRMRILAGKAPATSAQRWVGVPGLTGAALDSELTRLGPVRAAADARQRAALLAELLAVRPLSSFDWLSFAGMRLAAGDPDDRVRQAFDMSWLTGPNEGNVMIERAAFGLVLWERLPSSSRQHAIADLAGALRGTTVSDEQMLSVSQALQARSAEARRQIADRLRVSGVGPDALARLGL